jgi:YD repeat-containing protein
MLTVALVAQGSVRYVYDELGRLVGVIDASGEAAVYHYDPVGNLLGITRTPSTQVSVIEFTPDAGAVGQSVTIHGTGFSATAGLNTVTVNGTAATITAASTTMLVVMVAPSTTSGLISVTSPNGSANSASSFAVTASMAPTISGTTPTQGVIGTSVTISGTNFQPSADHNLVTFNASPAHVTAVTSTSITTTVPPTATSGKISVATPFGVATDTTDFIVPPSPFGTSDVEVTYRMSPGSSQNVTVSTANKVALVLFDATAGQRVSLKISTGVSALVKLYNYDGAQLGTGSTNQFIDTMTLTATGSYSILVDPVGTATGTLTLTLYDVPPDVTGTISADGTSLGVTIAMPGQNARLTFAATAGQRISLKVGSGSGGNVHIIRPDRAVLASVAIGPVFATFIDTQTLPMAGTYTVLVDYGTNKTGSITLNLYTVPADVTAPITAGGSSVTLTASTPGQNGIATFTGTINHRMSVWITGVSAGSVEVSLRDPDGVALRSLTVATLGGFLEPVLLPVSGAHTIFVDPGGSRTGSVTLRLYDIPDDVLGTLTVNGGGTAVSLPGPGQTASYTFAGVASQQITVRVTDSDINQPTGGGSTVTVKLVRANGTVLASSTSSFGSFNLATQTLPATETYTVLIDPSGPNIGTLTVSVTNP